MRERDGDRVDRVRLDRTVAQPVDPDERVANLMLVGVPGPGDRDLHLVRSVLLDRQARSVGHDHDGPGRPRHLEGAHLVAVPRESLDRDGVRRVRPDRGVDLVGEPAEPRRSGEIRRGPNGRRPHQRDLPIRPCDDREPDVRDPGIDGPGIAQRDAMTSSGMSKLA